MNELIPISEHNGQKAVSARLLHEFLESKQDFSNWIQNRIKKYGLVENQDFSSFNKIIERETGATIRIEYALTIDAAKELSMVEGNEKGKQARRYFIECEKSLHKTQLDFSNPDTVLMLAQNWKDEQTKRLAAEKQVSILAPKADFADRAIDTGHLTDIGQAAKILKLPFGRNTFFEKLRQDGIFFKNRNEPKQEYIERGYFELREKEVPRNNHPSFMVTKVLVTQKGLYWLSKKYDGSLAKVLSPISVF